MSQGAFFVTALVGGGFAFLTFRWLTAPTSAGDSPLQWFLVLAFFLAPLISAAGFVALCRRCPWRWLRLMTVPVLLFAFVYLCGMGVVAATRASAALLRAQGFNEVACWHQYAATSGMQMTDPNHDTWYYVIFACLPGAFLLCASSAIAAFAGFHAPQSALPRK